MHKCKVHADLDLGNLSCGWETQSLPLVETAIQDRDFGVSKQLK